MDALVTANVLSVQKAFAVIGTLALTTYLFPKQAVVEDMDQFDYVIVGAGSAGSVLAARLSECLHTRVLLLEAGDDPPVEALSPGLFNYLPQTRVDFNYTSEKDPDTYRGHRNKALNLTAGRCLGGSSSVNYMLYVRGCPGDYQYWAAASQDPTWTWDGVYPYFIKSENLQSSELLHSPFVSYHGTEGPLGVTREASTDIHKYLKSFEEVGEPFLFDINGPHSKGYTPQMFTIAHGARQSTANAYLSPVKDRPNLVVRKNSFVTKILMDDEKTARAVEFLTENNKVVRVGARREVIVSAGTFNSARLLMLSGIGPADHLSSLGIPVIEDLRVGYNYQDHALSMMAIRTEEANDPPRPPPVDPTKLPFPIFTGYASLERNKPCPEYQAVIFDVSSNSPAPSQLCSFNFGLENNICENLLNAGKGRKTLFVNLNILHPKSRGRVKLRSTNPMDPPVIEPMMLSDKRDLDSLAKYLAHSTKVLNSTYFRSIKAEFVDLSYPNCKEFAFGSREFWRCYVQYVVTTMYHYAGTCSMGAVVDSHLRVYGTRRLRVVDASVIPYLPSGNINAPVIMLAEKAADLILSEHGCAYNAHKPI